MLDSPELRLALTREDLRDLQADSFFNTCIEVDVRPTELTREQASSGGFSAAHETRQADQLRRAVIDRH